MRSVAAASKVVNAADAAAAADAVPKAPKRVRPPKAAKPAPFALNPQGDAAEAAPKHSRAGSDQLKRTQEMVKGMIPARTDEIARNIETRARAIVDTHTRQLTASKKKYPHIQAIQDMRPMTIEEARSIVHKQGASAPTGVTSGSPVKPSRRDEKAVADNLNMKAATNTRNADGLLKPFAEMDN